MASTLPPQITELEDKALAFLADAKAPVSEYVGRVAGALADRLPEERPDVVAQGIDVLVAQVDFAKKLLDAQVDLVKAALDAAVKPVRPVRSAKPKAAKAA